jgi:hypothetical protein
MKGSCQGWLGIWKWLETQKLSNCVLLDKQMPIPGRIVTGY